jgi:hypothetical protein
MFPLHDGAPQAAFDDVFTKRKKNTKEKTKRKRFLRCLIDLVKFSTSRI